MKQLFGAMSKTWKTTTTTTTTTGFGGPAAGTIYNCDINAKQQSTSSSKRLVAVSAEAVFDGSAEELVEQQSTSASRNVGALSAEAVVDGSAEDLAEHHAGRISRTSKEY